MKTTYALTGIDEKGNIVLEHELSDHEVISILAVALKKEKGAVIETISETLPPPAPVKKYKKHIKTFEEHEILPTRKNKEAAVKTGRGLSHEILEEIKNLNRVGKTDAEIMEKTGASKSTVYRTLRGAGLESNKSGMRKQREKLPEDTTRPDAMTFAKYGQVKVALDHQMDVDTIAHEMHIDVKEVEEAQRSKNFEQYAAV